MKKKSFYERGFTFIELILYIAIVTIILAAIIPFAWSVIGSGAKSGAQQEVSSQIRYVSERLKYEIRNASMINTSDFGVNLASDQTKQLSLTSPVNGTTLIKVTSSGVITITYGGNMYNLNSSDIKVTNLTFTNLTASDYKAQNIQYTITFNNTYNGNRQEYSVPSVTIEGAAELRSPAPFVFSPTDDTFVMSLAPSDVNGGINNQIGVDFGDATRGNIVSYIKFDLTSLAGKTVTSAKLQLTSGADGTLGVTNLKQVSNTTWVEETTSYSNAPALGSLIQSIISFTPSTTQQFDVTSYVVGKAGQLVSFGLDTAQGDELWIISKENVLGKPPLLIVTY
jgi:type II secretory pathway pseudopilin PulG